MEKFQETAILRVIPSVGATKFAAPFDIEQGGTGAKLVDADGDGTPDIITKIGGRFVALLTRGKGVFETRALGIPATAEALTFATEPAHGDSPARLHILYNCLTADGETP